MTTYNNPQAGYCCRSTCEGTYSYSYSSIKYECMADFPKFNSYYGLFEDNWYILKN